MVKVNSILMILLLSSILFLQTITTSIIPASAEIFVPNWIKNVAGWWSQGLVTTEEYVTSLQWLIEHNIIILSEASAQQSVSASGSPIIFTSGLTTMQPGDWCVGQGVMGQSAQCHGIMVMIPADGKLSNLFVRTSGAPAIGDMIITLHRFNVGNTPLACTLDRGADDRCSNTTDSIPVQMGDIVYLRLQTVETHPYQIVASILFTQE